MITISQNCESMYKYKNLQEFTELILTKEIIIIYYLLKLLLIF